MEERETNAEPLFGNWHTDWSTQAASIKLPVVSTCVSDKHLLNLMCGITKTYNSGGAVQMFYAHSYIQNASLLDSKPKHNLGVCVWTQCRNSINHERLLSLCFHCSPSCVCVLLSKPVAVTHNRHRCLIDSLQPDRVSEVIYVWSELAVCHFPSLSSLPGFLSHLLVFLSTFFYEEQHLLPLSRISTCSLKAV